MRFSSLLLTIFTLDALAQDLSDNDRLKSFRLQEKSFEVHEDQLSRSFLPKVNLTLGEEYFGVDTVQPKTEAFATLEARLNLFNGGMDRLHAEIAQLKTGLSRWQTKSEEREELKKVRLIQTELIYNRELMGLLGLELKENNKLKLQAARRARSGVDASTVMLEFDMNASELEEAIESLEHENLILKLRLAPLLGLKATELRIPDKLEHHHEENLLTSLQNFKLHPRVAMFRSQSELSHKERSITRRSLLPKLELFAGHYHNYEMFNRDFRDRNQNNAQGVGLRVLVNLFDGFESSTKATSLAHEEESKMVRARYEEKLLESEHKALQEELIHTHEIMHTILQRAKQSQEYLRLTLKEYDRGVKSSLDALTALQRKYQYEKQYIEKKRDYENFKAEILALIGE